MKSGKGFYKPLFSHIYIEESIEGRDSVLRIIKRFPSAVIIRIKHYKDVFNKPSQNPGMQMNSQKLILAENKGRRIFPGAPYCHDFGHRSFYYTSQVQNCPFDCSYCYLKGKFPTSNILVFINTQDYFDDIEDICTFEKPFITLSYDSDMAALEPLLQLLEDWYGFIESHPKATFELRTKSLYTPSCGPLDNLVHAYSVLPQPVIDLYEKGTPRLERRLVSLKRLMDKGYKVRLCIDPILDIDNYKTVYGDFIETLSESIDLRRITDISAGCFRMPADYHKSMFRGYGGHFIHYYPFETSGKQVRYSKAKEQDLLDSVLVPLADLYDEKKIYVR